MFATLLRALRRWVRSFGFSPNADLRTLREQYACHRISRDEYERVKRDLCD